MELNRKKNLEAILAICVGLLVFFWIFGKDYILIAAIVIGASGLLSTFLAEKIAWLWYKLAAVLGKVNGFILLTILFYFILTPIAWLSKVFKKDDLQLKKKSDPNASYFVERNHTFSKEDLEKPW